MQPGPFHCHACSTKLELAQKPGRRDDCPQCGAELHACMNCELFDPNLARGCRENQADDVRDKERANFCGWFVFRIGLPEGAGRRNDPRAAFNALFGGKVAESNDQQAMSAFFDGKKGKKPDALAERFKKPEKREDAERDQAKAAFDKLFKR